MLAATATGVLGGPTTTALASGTVTELAAGQQASAASVPWSQVGPGWLLIETTPTEPAAAAGGAACNITGKCGPSKPSPNTLYLVDPLGGRYTITTGAATPSGTLVAWSGDGTRALFEGVTNSATAALVTVLQLQSGRSTKFTVVTGAADPYRVVGFTEPDGLAVIAGGQVLFHGTTPVQRFSLNGALQYSYPVSFAQAGHIEGGLLYSLDGTELVLATSGGFEVVTNEGQPIRSIAMSKKAGTCSPLSWWPGPPSGTGVFLASCDPDPNEGTSVLWLVNASGGYPPARLATPSSSSIGNGDLDAWELPGGVYVQVGEFCQNSLAELGPNGDGRTRPVTVPGMGDSWVDVLGAYGDRLALNTYLGCTGADSSVVWFNPETKVVTPALGPPANRGYVEGAILFGQTAYGL